MLDRDKLPRELKIVSRTAQSDFRGIVALFVGDSGTGKAMAAKTLADHLDSPFLRQDLSLLVSKYLDETEKNLHKVFDAAENRSGVLFFDEADALFDKRTDVKDTQDRHTNISLNFCRLAERFNGIVILATQKRENMDEAFLKRIPHVLVFPLRKGE